MQQQLFTKDFIIKRIQDSGFPCWNLSITTGFRNNVNVQSYFGADWNDDDNEATKIEKSITRLENTLSTFPADTVFVIDIRAARNANGTSIIGPFQFTTAEQTAPEQTQQTQQLGLIPSGYVPESMLKGLEEQLTKNFEAKFDALKAEHQQQQREFEFNNRLERLEEREKEVKELEKSYKSDVAKGADVVVEIVKKIGAYFLMPKGAAQDAQIISQQQLGAMQQAQQPQQQDPKETKVDEICTLLYNNYSIEQLNDIQKQLQNGNMGEQAATTSSATTAI